MKKLILILLPLLSSCSASLETRLSKNTPNAPVNEINGGIVSYLNQGWPSAIKARRQDAYKKMTEYCHGPYRIVQEGEQASAGIASTVGGSTIYDQQRDWKIRFECVN